MPALNVDFGTGCTIDTSLYNRRPSIPCLCRKNLEQSAVRSDVFGLPVNI